MGSGCSKPEGGRCEGLVWAQTEQAEMKSLTSWLNSGHQNFLSMKAMVRLIPGWPDKLDECPHRSTWGRTPTGMNRRLSGQVLGANPSPSELRTVVSMSMSMVLIKTSGRRIVSGAGSWAGGLKWHDKASGLVFLEPGW